ncbi:MAG: lysophospholipid acyltransferase family protein [Candidatus Dormibacteria bacterium]
MTGLKIRISGRTAGKLSAAPEFAPDPKEPWLPYVGLRVAEAALRMLDRRAAYAVTAPLAAFLTTCWPAHWKGLRTNLIAIRPDLNRREMRRLLRRNVRNFLKAWIDVLQMAHRPQEAWTPWLRMRDVQYLDSASELGRGVIIVSLHLGSWEAAIAALQGRFEAKGSKLALLAEQVRPIRCFNWLVAARSRVGCQVIPLNVDAARRGDQIAVHRSGAAAVRQIYRMLSHNGVVVMAIDRDLLGTGVPVPFCGRRASIPLGAVEIAARTGAAILPVAVVRDDHDNYLCRAYPPIQVKLGPDPEQSLRIAAHDLLQMLEPELRAHPDQWHVMHPIFGPPMSSDEMETHFSPVVDGLLP